MKTQGWSLIELAVILVILSCLMVIGLPTFTTYMEQTRADVRITELYNTLVFLRNAAFSKQEAGVICPSSDEQHCSSDWSGNLMAFLDFNRNHMRDSQEPLLRMIVPTSGGTLSWQGFGASTYLTFLPYGLTNQQNGTFFYCSPSQQKSVARGIIINKSGRARIAQVTDQEGIIDANGAEKHC